MTDPQPEAPAIPDEPEEQFCSVTAYVDGHAFVSADGEDWPTLTCARQPDHDGLHYDEMNLIEWAAVPTGPGPWIDVTENTPPVAASLDREAVRQIVSDAIEKAWWSQGGPASEEVMRAIWPLLEHAQAALSGNEGVRLWMLDCGELVAKHRERALAAEGKLASLRAVLLEGGQDAATVRRRALAVIGSEEDSNGRAG